MDIKRILLIIGGVLAVAAIAGCIILYVYYSGQLKEQQEASNETITKLTTELSSYEEKVTVYYLAQKVVAGQEVNVKTQMIKKEIPKAMVSDEYVTSEDNFVSSYYNLDLKEGTPITFSVIGSDIITHQDRYYDIVAHVFPVGMKQGDFVDLRIVTDYGQDYTVLVKKRVVQTATNSVKLILNEEEIHRYNSAIVDSFLNAGTNLYLTTYVQPAFQREAQAFYPVSKDVLDVMTIDPNIKQVAELEVIKKRRDTFEAALESHTDPSRNGAVASGRTDFMQRLLADIQEYNERINNGIIDPATGTIVDDGTIVADIPASSDVEE